MHHQKVNYFRFNLQKSLTFEYKKNFDRSRTIRISYKQGFFLSEQKLKEIFSNYNLILWDNLEIFYHPITGRIEDVYLICENNTEARKIYEDRVKIMQKWSKENLDFNISHLPESFEDILSVSENLKFPIENSGLMVFPLESSFGSFPKKGERLKVIHNLIGNVLKISPSEYTVTNCKNKISEYLSYNFFLIAFENKENLNLLYNLQPFYESVVFHKFIHSVYFPLIRHNKALCINCNEKVDPKCIYELCHKCCTDESMILYNLLKSKIGKCDHVNSKKQEELPKLIPVYLKEIINFDYEQLVEYLQIKKSLFSISFIEDLKNSNFGLFFRPISNTSKTRLIIDMNKELSVVMDNSNYKRENVMKLNDRMYKCFTFQHNKISKFNYQNYEIMKSFDLNGNYYIEANFSNKSNTTSTIQHYVPCDINNISQISWQEYREIEKLSRSSYHLMLCGVDVSTYSNQEIIDEIYIDLKNKSFKLIKDDISVVNEVAVISKLSYLIFKDYIINSNLIQRQVNLEDKINELGRIVTVKLNENESTEALKVFMNKIKLNIPLIRNCKGSPIILPGSLLLKFISNINK